MMNLLTTFTNFTVYYPIRYALLKGDFITASIVGLSGGASMISHLFESHKHNMWGFGTDSVISYYLNRLDVGMVSLTLLRCFQLWYQSGLRLSLFQGNHLLIISTICASLCNLISEQDPGYTFYIPFHCIWHLSIFLILFKYLQIVI